MKNNKLKIIIIAILILILSSVMMIAYADTSFTFTVNPTETTAEVGDTITVDLGIADIDQNTDGINAIQGDLSYDGSVFENVEISTSESNWSVTFNQLNESNLKGRFVISNLSGAKSTQKVAQLKATIKSTTNATSGTINLNNVFSSYGTTDTAKTNHTIKVKINKKNNSGIQDNNIVGNVVNQNVVKGSSNIPQTGVTDWIFVAILVASIMAIIGYIRYKRIDK